MEGHELGPLTRAEIVRLVRSLGKHRYVAGRAHQLHAFVFEAIGRAPGLEDAHAWMVRTLNDTELDPASKDPRLLRDATDEELALALEQLWTQPGVLERLAHRLEPLGLEFDPNALPFDELREEDIFPRLIDAGWELLPLAALDPTRHAGAIRALDAQEGELDYEVARFEEENTLPPLPTLYELPLFGVTELVFAFEDDEPEARTRAPFVLWAQGHPVYVDYVLRGCVKVAKLTEVVG